MAMAREKPGGDGFHSPAEIGLSCYYKSHHVNWTYYIVYACLVPVF